MKTTTKKLTLKTLVMFIGVMGLTLFVFSCAKNGNNNQQNNNVFQNCSNCSGIVNGQVFFQSQSSDLYNRLTADINFIGSGPNYSYQQGGQYNPYGNSYYNGQNYNSYGASPIVGYSGPVAVQGQININQVISSYGGCYIQPGSYALQTIQAGQWNQAIVSGLVMQAYSGSSTMIVQIPQAQVAAKSQLGQLWNEVAPVGKLFGNLVIQSVNGMTCQTSVLLQ